MNLANQRLSIYELTDLVQSRTGAGNNFNGLEPETAITTSPARIEWAASTNAGLIDPAALGLSGAYRIVRLHLIMAGQDTYSINLIDGSSTIVLASGTTATNHNAEGLGFLLDGQKLQVVTTGAATSSVKMIVGLAHASAVQPAVK